MNNTSVDSYLSEGCGRCDRFQTPSCKVHLWKEALTTLRELLLETELVEEMKWGSPCYTLEGKNVIMLASFNEECGISFLKGIALVDEGGLLTKPGPNTRVARVCRFRSVEEVEERREHLRSLIRQAVEVERSGVEVVAPDDPSPVPFELQERLDADPELRQAFDELTPGRQRSYIIHVSGAKQSATRARRAERCAPKIMEGKGFNER